MHESAERVPPIRPEVAKLFQDLLFWSFFISQGRSDLQRDVLTYAAYNTPQLAELLPHIAISRVGSSSRYQVQYSKEFMQKVGTPIATRVSKYVSSRVHTHKKIGKVSDELFGGLQNGPQPYQYAFDNSPQHGAEIPHFALRISAVLKAAPAEREELGELVERIGYLILTRDVGYAGYRPRDTHAGIFGDKNLSHLCYFGLLGLPVPPTVPAIYKDLFRSAARAMVKRAQKDRMIRHDLVRLIKEFNDTHPKTMVPPLETLEEQYA